jgi:serine/threonine-protein kinase RsbW
MQSVVWTQGFPGEAASIGEVRHFVGGLLTGWPCADDARLVASELATNAVQHTASGEGRGFAVVVAIGPDRVRVAVKDAGAPQSPIMLADAAERTDVNGRGLFIVAALAKEWGVDEAAVGRTVWAEFPRVPEC